MQIAALKMKYAIIVKVSSFIHSLSRHSCQCEVILKNSKQLPHSQDKNKNILYSISDIQNQIQNSLFNCRLQSKTKNTSGYEKAEICKISVMN